VPEKRVAIALAGHAKDGFCGSDVSKWPSRWIASMGSLPPLPPAPVDAAEDVVADVVDAAAPPPPCPPAPPLPPPLVPVLDVAPDDLHAAAAKPIAITKKGKRAPIESLHHQSVSSSFFFIAS